MEPAHDQRSRQDEAGADLRGCLKSPDSRQILSSMCSFQLPESWHEACTTFCELGIGRTFQTSSETRRNDRSAISTPTPCRLRVCGTFPFQEAVEEKSAEVGERCLRRAATAQRAATLAGLAFSVILLGNRVTLIGIFAEVV